jgi:hypothetical protein
MRQRACRRRASRSSRRRAATLTETEGTACGLSEEPHVSACNYNQAKAILEWIYGPPLADPTPSPTGKFITFDQSAFNKGVSNGLAAEGVVYVPTECANHPGCRLHIALHGCDQARETVGDAFINESGFAPYADTNWLVILFPQVAGSTVNPHGCWDWWGYSDIDYLDKDAPQIQAIRAMAGASFDAALREPLGMSAYDPFRTSAQHSAQCRQV